MTEALANCLKDPRQPGKTQHGIIELVRQPDVANGLYDIHWLEKFLGKP